MSNWERFVDAFFNARVMAKYLPDIAHGTLVIRPYNSPLMKFPMRPRPRPIGTATDARSAISQKFQPFLRHAIHAAMITPMNPP